MKSDELIAVRSTFETEKVLERADLQRACCVPVSTRSPMTC